MPAVTVIATPVHPIILHLVQLLLLFGREERADLRPEVVHHRFCFLHRFPMNLLELRTRLIEHRLDLRLLIGGEIEVVGHSFERALSSPSTATAVAVVARVLRIVCQHQAAEGQNAERSH